MTSQYLQARREMKLTGKPVNEKKSANQAEADRIFFEQQRPLLTGVCACGCGQPSSKHDDRLYKFSIAHVLPKALFQSVRHHPENWVERNFWNGCHSNMDNRSIEHWPGFKDWPEIVRKFYILEKCLTKLEKAKKFYTNLKTIIENNGKR